MNGKGKGCISNCSDPFHCASAFLKVFIGRDIKNSSLSYLLNKGTESISMYASAYNIRIECTCSKCKKEALVQGKGYIEKTPCDKKDIKAVKFKLKVWGKEKIEFNMRITSDDCDELIHDSGNVKVENADYVLPINICCI